MNERVRVTSPRTTSGRRLPPPSAAHEIDAQSQVGEVYLRSLLRAQLRLALVVASALFASPAVLAQEQQDPTSKPRKGRSRAAK